MKEWAQVTVAGIAGIAKLLDVQVVGVLAALPALVSFIGPRFQCHETVQWHTDFQLGLDKLDNELRLQVGPNATDSEVAAVSVRYSDFVAKMEKEAKKIFTKSWDFAITRRTQP